VQKRIAVTGATGFVGPHLMAALARRGWSLRLLVRRWSPLPPMAGVDAEVVWGDLADEAALRALVTGVDAVIHLAGLIKARRQEDFATVNRDGTARLSTLAPDTPFIFLSSLTAREPHLSPYAASKRAAEEALSSQRSGPWLALRAPAVYGPGDRETLAYFRSARWGIALQPAVPGARLSLIHVTDLAEALALAVEQQIATEIYEIDDGRDGGYSYADMAKAAGHALGRDEWTVAIPRTVFVAIAMANQAIQSMGGSAKILTKNKANEIFHSDWVVRDRRFAAATGFAPRFDLGAGFGNTISWYRTQRWL
jgi:2-alkyl-3-oxoalkanoate reductase